MKLSTEAIAKVKGLRKKFCIVIGQFVECILKLKPETSAIHVSQRQAVIITLQMKIVWDTSSVVNHTLN